MEYEKRKFPKVFAQTQEHLETLRFLVGFAQEQLETHYILKIIPKRNGLPAASSAKRFPRLHSTFFFGDSVGVKKFKMVASGLHADK